MKHPQQSENTTPEATPQEATSSQGVPGRKDLAAKAIVVAHGIGQQRPFQVLDSFAHGLARTLDDTNKTKPTKITHVKLPEGQQFDHCIRLHSANFSLDIYEYYWAPMTEGKASFSGVMGWLRVTAFTPLQRLAYNIPLVLLRSKSVPSACFQLLRELWRVVYIPLIVLGITGVAGYLVANVATFTKDVFKILQGAISPSPQSTHPQFEHSLSNPADIATLLIFLGMLLAFTSLLLSVPTQLRDMFRVRNVLHDRKRNPLSTLRTAYSNAKGDWVKRFGTAAKHVNIEENRWSIQIRARRWLSLVTILGILFLGWCSYLVVSGRENQFLITRPLTSVVHDLIIALGKPNLEKLAIIVGLLSLATLLKRVFVDYIGDIALYATADENSAFFRTRIEILTQATRRIRWLVRTYENVAVAGHSLGSVIMYDALSWLRVESQVGFGSGSLTDATISTFPVSQNEFARLQVLITFGSPLDKIVYFFRTTVRAYETIRAHILNELYGFRLPAELLVSDPAIDDLPPFKPPDTLKWLNVYSPADPISARLAYFEGVDNYWRWYWLWGLAHLSYWHDNKFYQRVLHEIA
jgi:hypothetical protein